jgi:hypothetical protein
VRHFGEFPSEPDGRCRQFIKRRFGRGTGLHFNLIVGAPTAAARQSPAPS